MLEENGYQRAMVDNTLCKCDKKRLQKKKGERSTPQDEVERIATVVVPYVKGVTGQVGRVLSSVGIRTVNKADPWLWRICQGIKDSGENDKKNGVIYEIKCGDCGENYIGETMRSLKTCLGEHRCHAKPGARYELSAVAEHAQVNKHQIDWDSAVVVGRERRWHPRKVKETLMICAKKLAMNKDKGMKLSVIWKDIAEKEYKKHRVN